LAELAALLRDAPRAELLATLLAPYVDRHVLIGLGAGTLGSAARAAGLLALTAGDADTAVPLLDRALADNVRLGARLWVARTRFDLARALEARGGGGDAARAAALREEAAREAEGLGMMRLAADAARSSLPGGATTTPAAGSVVVSTDPVPFRRQGEYWTIGRADASFRLRDTKGLGYLATLLRHPGREFHVLDLVRGGEGAGIGLAEAAGADLA